MSYTTTPTSIGRRTSRGFWVCKKSEMKMEEHTKRWEEYRNSQSPTDEISHDLSFSEHDIWVQGNLNKYRIYDFDAEGVVMKQQSRQSVSTRSFSVNNCNVEELVRRLNGSVCKAAKEAREEELRKKIEEDVTTNLTAQSNNQWAEREAALKNDLAKEKVAREQERKDRNKISKLWSFFKT